MSYTRKTRLNWTLTEKPVQPSQDLTNLGQELLAFAEVVTRAGTLLYIFGEGFRSGAFLPSNSLKEVIRSGKHSTSADSSTKTRPTSYSKGKSNERTKIPRRNNR